MTNTESQMQRTCENIVKELEGIYNGELTEEFEKKIEALKEQIEELEDKITDDSTKEEDNETTEKIKELENEIEELEEEKETNNFWDYFNDVFDIEYTISGNGDFRGVCLMVACGGPNIYVDTNRREVWGAWWGEKTSTWLPSEICDEIDSVFEEYYQATR